MKRLYKRNLALLLIAVCILLPTACGPVPPQDRIQGIKIENDTAYSEETLEYAEQTIYSLAVSIYKKTVMSTVSEKVDSRLKNYARGVRDITCAQPISEERYRWAIDCLAEQGEAAMDDIISLRRGVSTDLGAARRLYLDFSSAFGADQAASMLYDCCLLTYDTLYERTMENFEAYKYPWYLEEAEALLAEKTIFMESIGKSDFSALVRCSTAMAELSCVGEGDVDQGFSNAELLEIIRHLELSDIDIDAKGWKLLLSYSLGGEDGSYRARMVEVLNETGDIEKLADKMNEGMALTVKAIDRLDAEDIDMIRNGKRKELLVSVFSRFEDADWESFRAVSDIDFSDDAYTEIALEEYGEDYVRYLSGLRGVDFHTLRASVNTEDFCSCLEDYVASAFPMIWYEVRYDKD